ncbi:patatin-like phospholipase family protein [Burkholderia sp. SCN-KJ]|uniref:patatin-like phospholipase family protein n=1 Tax=Burkholderia sp. SCN-KJ TaxID=2969248 RepID=UPI00214F907B|nr:patatin-like phospholipase family protein [Burkholderia sp. SCN-KJ]MCR4470397.1 patatin-like phospholipase family protein [Burkholderia sp. SCN-KJ]
MTTGTQGQVELGLALSGGGVRAAAFHAGVLQYFAEQGQLEDVGHVSSVSGGSLFVGLVMSRSKYEWPTSVAYRDQVFMDIRTVLTTTSLQRSALFRMLGNPLNWRFLTSRANIIEQAIRAVWKIDVPIGSLKHIPVWSINGTSGETGVRFRFKGGRMGDYQSGYASVSHLNLASALAVSAAFPGLIGPLAIRTRDFQWMKREHWNSPDGEKPYDMPYARLHLYDGGIYDNLGIEPLFDVGKQRLKNSGDERVSRLIVSDAGAAFFRKPIPHPLNPRRFRRIADIALEQTRALRVRSFANFLQSNAGAGLYLRIGDDAETAFRKWKDRVSGTSLNEHNWLSKELATRAARVPTTLDRLDEEVFDLLARHGRETAKWNNEMWCH